MKRLGRVHFYRGEMKLSPLFIEATVAILTGLFLFVWGFIFFSNNIYQLSSYTKLRNMFISEEREEKFLEDIHCITIDAEMALILEERIGDITDYYYIAQALEAVKDFALAHPERRVVTGIDFAFLSSLASSEGPPQATDPLADLIDVLAQMPKNMFVVIGGILSMSKGTIKTLHTDFVRERIIYPATEHDYDMEYNYFIGNIHILEGAVQRGGEGGEEEMTAIGYVPLASTGKKHFFSLPVAMYIAGEIMEPGAEGDGQKPYDFWTDFIMGNSSFDYESGFVERFERKTGRRFLDFGSRFYYNFFTDKGIQQFKYHHIQLSDIAEALKDEEERTKYERGIEGHYRSLASLDKEKDEDELFTEDDAVSYFFVSFGAMPEFLLREGEENDLVVSPAAKRNSFTNEMEEVAGVMTHITALSNLRNQFYIKDSSRAVKIITIALTVLVVAAVFLITWSSGDLKRASLYTFIIVGGLMCISIGSFFGGYLINAKTGLLLSLVGFAGISIFRFIYTASRHDMYELVAARTFTAAQLERLREKVDWKRPKIVEDAIILVLFPRNLPEIGETEEEADIYTGIYNKYLELVFKTFEKYNGNRILLSLDGVMGYWNVPTKSVDSVKNSFDCAKEFIGLLPEWQEYINRQYEERTDKERYVAAFDICLNVCRCYAGLVGVGETHSYTLSGDELNETILSVLSMRGDVETTLFVTDDFYEALEKRGLVTNPGAYTEKNIGIFKLFQYDLQGRKGRK